MVKKLTKERLLIIIICFLLIVNYKMGLGCILGTLFYYVYTRFLHYRVDAIIRADGVSFLAYFQTIISLGILACPIWISLKFDNIFHWLGVFIALMYDKYYLYICSFLGVSND